MHPKIFPTNLPFKFLLRHKAPKASLRVYTHADRETSLCPKDLIAKPYCTIGGLLKSLGKEYTTCVEVLK